MLPAGGKEGRAWVPRDSDSVGDRDAHQVQLLLCSLPVAPAMASLPQPVFLRVGLLAASQFCQPLGNPEPVPPQCTPLTQPSTPVLPSPRPSCAPCPLPARPTCWELLAASPCLRAVLGLAQGRLCPPPPSAETQSLLPPCRTHPISWGGGRAGHSHLVNR